MKLFSRALLVAALCVPTVAMARPDSKTKDAKGKKPAMVMCTVMNHEVPKKDAKMTTYKGKTYHFCCTHCVDEFKKNPAKYTKTSTKKKP